MSGINTDTTPHALANPLRPLKYHHSGAQMILGSGKAVNKPPSEDDRKPHWGGWAWKPIHNHCDEAKGSIICFPCSQKFMSDGLAIGAYPLPARFLPPSPRGGERSREQRLNLSQTTFMENANKFLFVVEIRTERDSLLFFSVFFISDVQLSHKNPYTPPPRPILTIIPAPPDPLVFQINNVGHVAHAR